VDFTKPQQPWGPRLPTCHRGSGVSFSKP